MKVLKILIKQMLIANNRFIFISYATKQSLDNAYKICRYWWDKGYIPICPKILFSYMANDRDRGLIMLVCKIFVCLCRNFVLYSKSEGCIEEYKLAKKLHKKIYILCNDNINYEKMMQNNKEVFL